MEITRLPFNRLIGLQKVDDGDAGLLALPDDKRYTNHVGTLHAAALFSLAEASSGEFLRRNVDADTTDATALLRTGEIKYCQPARGQIVARSSVHDLALEKLRADMQRRRRTRISINVAMTDGDGHVVAEAVFVWVFV